jgi:hypothetical protein
MVGKLGEAGRAYAKAEHDYKVLCSQRILIRRSDGMPVTAIKDIVRGEREVARLRLERDIALTMYEVAKESINAEKLIIRILDAQITREWGK